jgi:hypothetical protein
VTNPLQGDLFAPRTDALQLPERVPMLALHARFARRVELGIKTIETRTWPWPYPPGWLVICASKALGGVPLDPPGVTVPDEECPLQALTCLVWIAGSRPLLPEDERAACFYAEGRFSFPHRAQNGRGCVFLLIHLHEVAVRCKSLFDPLRAVGDIRRIQCSNRFGIFFEKFCGALIVACLFDV